MWTFYFLSRTSPVKIIAFSDRIRNFTFNVVVYCCCFFFFRFCALHARLAYTLRMVTNHWKLINKNLIMFLVHIRSRAKLWFISKQTSFSEMVSAKRWKTISRRRREKTATFNMAKRAFVDRFEKSCFTFALFKLITYLRLCDGRISQALERRKKCEYMHVCTASNMHKARLALKWFTNI